jgi:carbamoyltransferase
MPIVETPEQAVQFFLECALDVLVLDNFIVRKAPRKAAAANNSSHLFINDIRTSLERNVGRLGRLSGVYQLNIAGTRSWTIDLSNGSPSVTEGVGAPSPNAVIHLTESDIDSLRSDPETQGVKLFREGRVKVEGNPAYALNVAQILMMR